MITTKTEQRLVLTPEGRDWLAKNNPLAYQQIIQAESLYKISQRTLARIAKELEDGSK